MRGRSKRSYILGSVLALIFVAGGLFADQLYCRFWGDFCPDLFEGSLLFIITPLLGIYGIIAFRIVVQSEHWRLCALRLMLVYIMGYMALIWFVGLAVSRI